MRKQMDKFGCGICMKHEGYLFRDNGGYDFLGDDGMMDW